jgi:hypothetical protein
LGPFSFQVFVLAGWTETKLQGGFEVNQKAMVGRRAKSTVGKGCRKRPLALEVRRQKRKKARRAIVVLHRKKKKST